MKQINTKVEIPVSYFFVNFRRFKRAKGYSNPQLGEISGLHSNTIDKLSRGIVQPKLDFVVLISVLSGYTIDELCFTELYREYAEAEDEKYFNI